MLLRLEKISLKKFSTQQLQMLLGAKYGTNCIEYQLNILKHIIHSSYLSQIELTNIYSAILNGTSQSKS